MPNIEAGLERISKEALIV